MINFQMGPALATAFGTASSCDKLVARVVCATTKVTQELLDEPSQGVF